LTYISTYHYSLSLHDALPIFAGCATGEEAYSIAMICAEQTLNRIDVPKVQIFGTDIDEDAITVAREGKYSLNDAADVSPERLNRDRKSTRLNSSHQIISYAVF